MGSASIGTPQVSKKGHIIRNLFERTVGSRIVRLSTPDGTMLACDAVIAATGSRPSDWITDTGLAVREGGFVAVGSDLRSVSHSHIFAAGDIVSRCDRRVERLGKRYCEILVSAAASS